MFRWIFVLLGLVFSVPISAKQPNVLWIIADDHAPYVMGAYGNKQVRTPNLDQLASQGIRLDRAFCNAPVCTASRQSFLTGRYPRTVGVTQLSTPLPDGTITLAHLLSKAGYHTASIGKMHFNSNWKHGFDLRIDMPQFHALRKKSDSKPIPKEIETQPPWKPFKDPAAIWLNAKALPFAAYDADMPDTFLANKAVEYLKEKRDKPFFLMVSLYEPHSPFRFPVEYRGRINPKQMPVPKVGPEDAWQIPAIFRDLTDTEKQGINAAYYTSVEHMDKNVGLVLDALKESGQEKDTLVIYIGDHGYHLGHHGRFEKHCCYEEAIRTPLLIRWPDRIAEKQASSALVELIDLAPTILTVCSVEVPAQIQGKSLRPLLEGKTKQHREQVFIEYAENEEAAIRTDQWKLIYGSGKRQRQDGYETGKPLPGRTIQLFDLKTDPGEFTNLAQKPEHQERVQTMLQQLAAHLQQTARQPELIPKNKDIYELLDFCVQPRDVK